MANKIVIEYEVSAGVAASATNSVSDALNRQKLAASQAAKGLSEVKGSLKRMTDEAKKSVGAVGKLAAAIKRIVFYRAIRSAIRAVTQSFREGINNLYNYSAAMNSLDASRAKNTMDEFASTSLYLKNSLGAALMPILLSLLPIVNALADAFVAAANAVNQFIQMLRGNATYTKAKKQIIEYSGALHGAGRAAKELKKQLFGFDELNIFNSPSGGGGGGAAVPDYSNMFEEAAVGDWGELAKKVKEQLAVITGYVSAAVLAVGAILALSGINVPVGVAMMAAGAIGVMVSATNWNGTNEKVKKALAKVEMTIGGFLIGIGAILALSGANVPLGIGLIAAGAVAFASGATLNWDGLGSTVEAKLAFITAMVGAAFLFLGAVLAVSGINIPLGLGLLAAGALGIATGASMSDELREKIKANIGLIETIIGGALLFLGAIALFTGNIPLGLGLIVAGVLALSYGQKNLTDELQEKIGAKLEAIRRIVEVALIAIGAILLFVNPALGIPMLIAGLALAGTEIDWDNLNNKVKEAWEKVKATGRKIKQDLFSWWESIKSFFKRIVDFNASVTLTPSMEGGYGPRAQGFASGGYPETGTYFYAGEAGPELVGQVGGRTTVTSHDQFTAGMEDIMDNTNTVIMQAAQALISAIQNKDMTAVVSIGDRQIVSAYDRGKRLAGVGLVE